MDDPTKCVYQIIYDENDNDETKIIQYFIMHGLVLCIKVYSYGAHMLYSWSFIHNTAVPISINKKKYFPSLNIYTTVFFWESSNKNKNINQQLD